MQKKTYIIAAVVVIAAIAIAYTVISIQNSKSIKGGKDAVTRYDVASDTTKLKKSTIEVTLSDEEREKVLDILKNKMSEMDVDENDVVYDITIDFCNSNVGYLSSESEIFCMESVQYSLSTEDCEYIASLVKE